MSWIPDVPFNGLPPIPPAVDLETKRVLRAVTQAQVEVARLDEATALIPDPRVLLSNIALLEAQASSEIENIVTTADELFQQSQIAGQSVEPAVKETLRYRSALWSGMEAMQSRGLTWSTAREICSEVKGHEMAVRTLPGTRIANSTTRKIIYSPPEGHQLLMSLLGNWEGFVHNADVDPLVAMAVAHYQFEAIHPFADGNGRTGRILNILMLVNAGLLEQPVLYLSRPIIKSKDQYYRRLLEVTSRGAWEEWVLYMVEVVRQAAYATRLKVGAITRAREQFVRDNSAASAGMKTAAFQQLLFAQPYCRIAQVQRECNVSRPTASSWLSSLEDAGALTSMQIGRDKLYLNRSFWQALMVEP